VALLSTEDAAGDADGGPPQADGFATALSEAQARLDELEEVLADRETSIARLGLQVEELTNCLGAREDEREAAARQADTEASAAEDARQSLAQVQQSLVELQEQLAALTTERDALQSECDDRAFEREALGARVAELESAVQAEAPPEPEDSEARQALADAQKALTEVRQALATAQEQLATLTTERDALVEETLRWDGLKAAFEGERSALQAEVERLRPLAEKAGTGPDETLTARVDSMAKELQEAVAEVASLRTANRAYVKRIARLLQDGAVERAEATGTSVPPVEETPAGANGAADRDAFKDSLERINERVSEMRTALDVLSGLLPEVLDRVASDDDEAVEQLRAALDELVSGNREVKSEVVAARQKVS
jgi:chromosome segregation ATPase